MTVSESNRSTQVNLGGMRRQGSAVFDDENVTCLRGRRSYAI